MCIFGHPVNFHDVGEMVMPLDRRRFGAWRAVRRWIVVPISINLDSNMIVALKEVSSVKFEASFSVLRPTTGSGRKPNKSDKQMEKTQKAIVLYEMGWDGMVLTILRVCSDSTWTLEGCNGAGVGS